MMKLVSTVIVVILVALIVWAVRAKPEKEVVAAILAAAAAVSVAIIGPRHFGLAASPLMAAVGALLLARLARVTA